MDITQLKGLLDYSPEEKQSAMNMGLLQAGLGILANNTDRNNPMQSIARGGMIGLQGYDSALQKSQAEKLKQLQTYDLLNKYKRQQEQEIALSKAPQNVRDAVAMGVPVGDVWKHLNPELKPQLVSVADPKEPLRTVSKWVVPGQTDGVVVGAGTMPEILDSRVQEARQKISAAGAPTTKVLMPPMETEQQKKLGAGFGEMRNELNNSAMQAPKRLADIDRMEQLLQGVEGGKLAPMGADIASAANSLGLKIDPKLGNKQASESLAIEMAMSYRQPGTGPMTDKDFENFQKIVPNLSKTAEGRAQIMATMRAKINRDREVARMARDYAKKNNGNLDEGFFDVVGDYYAKNPIFKPTSDAPPAGAVRRIK